MWMDVFCTCMPSYLMLSCKDVCVYMYSCKLLFEEKSFIAIRFNDTILLLLCWRCVTIESNEDDDDDMECEESDGGTKKDSQMIEVTLSGVFLYINYASSQC